MYQQEPESLVKEWIMNCIRLRPPKSVLSIVKFPAFQPRWSNTMRRWPRVKCPCMSSAHAIFSSPHGPQLFTLVTCMTRPLPFQIASESVVWSASNLLALTPQGCWPVERHLNSVRPECTFLTLISSPHPGESFAFLCLHVWSSQVTHKLWMECQRDFVMKRLSSGQSL